MKKRVITGVIALAIAMHAAVAQEATITQIDPSSLLATQTVKLYLDAGRSSGPVDAATLKVSESADGVEWQEVPVRSVKRNQNREEGISFYLLLDNSGSMWDGLDGKPTKDADATRVAHAKRAVNDFVSNLSVMDRVALASFNTNFKLVRPMSADASGIPSSLDGIKKPARDEAYTELYRSVAQAINGFGEDGRRKVLIVLSDGENFPLDAAASLARAEDGIDAANREGVTCYVVNFSESKDSQVHRVALESGGLVFDARDADELAGIYNSIRDNVLEEYTVTYTAAMLPGDRRYVKVESGGAEATRYYFTGTVLGSNTKPAAWYYLLFVCLPLLVWLALLLFRLERETDEAGIQLLYGAAGTKTKMFTLTGAQTVIGGSQAADITISGNPALKAEAATIVFDKTRQEYTITAGADLTVNNKPVKSKKLEPGDVINMAGTVVVFDNPTRTIVKGGKDGKK